VLLPDAETRGVCPLEGSAHPPISGFTGRDKYCRTYENDNYYHYK
jgi:hypothetical protein